MCRNAKVRAAYARRRDPDISSDPREFAVLILGDHVLGKDEEIVEEEEKLFALHGIRRGHPRARARSFSPGNLAKSSFPDLGWS